MRVLAVTVVIALGCSSKDGSPPPAPAPPAPPDPNTKMDVVEQLRGYTDRMCACKDDGCAILVMNEMSAWVADRGSATPEPADVHRMVDALSAKFKGCLAHLPVKQSAEPRVGQMEKLAKQLCTCTDDACRNAVTDEVAKVDLLANSSAFSKPDLERIEVAMRRIDECNLARSPTKPGAPRVLGSGPY